MVPLKFMSLFFACVFYALPFHSSAQLKDSLLTQLGKKWANSKTYTLKVAELMPEELYNYQPVPEEMSFKQQVLHIAQNIQWLSSSYLFSNKKAPINDTTVKDKAGVLYILNKAYDIGTAVHHDLREKHLDEVVPFFAGPMTRRQILLLLHDHQTHHVGQLIVYLRLKGIKPPEYMGW